MRLIVPSRRPAREHLDDAALDSAEMAKSLRDLDRLNRLWRASRRLARYLIDRTNEPRRSSLLVLDVGAGSGGVARALERRLGAAGVRARLVAVDVQWRHLACGRNGNSGGAVSLAANAFALPLADASVDWAVSTLFLHHFSPEDNVHLLRELGRVARKGVAMLDIRRHVLAYLAVALGGRLAFETPISVHDGQASVLQAYTAQEALAFAARALPGARVERVFPFRLLITAPGADKS